MAAPMGKNSYEIYEIDLTKAIIFVIHAVFVIQKIGSKIGSMCGMSR